MTHTCPDILRYIPAKWCDFVGNRRIKAFLRSMLKSLRRQMESDQPLDLNRLCFLLTGPSRSGKSSLIQHFVRCLACRLLDPETLDPCDFQCLYCQQRTARHGLAGLFHLAGQDSWWPTNRVPHFFPIDCTHILTPQELRDTIRELAEYESKNDLVVVYMDEVHRLVKRQMDELLLTTIEQKPFVWILSTAKPGDLEDMLLNRMLKFSTELPSEIELAVWLARLCTEWSIPWTSEAILPTVKKGNCVPGITLEALALAAVTPGGLTLELVEDLWTPYV